VICKNCGKNIHMDKDGMYLHDTLGMIYCNFDTAEPVHELTPAGLDLDLIGNRLPGLEVVPDSAAAALYRTVLRLAEKVGLE